MRIGVAIRVALAASLVLLTTITGAARAEAHSEIPGFRNVLDAVTPAVAEVEIDVVTSAADQLVAQNPTTTLLEVLADGGETFLRISAAGVEANLASPDWYRSATPEGDGRVPPTASAGAPAEWVPVSKMSSWGWFDHRLHEQRAETAPGRSTRRAAGDGSVRLASWTVPMRYGSQDLTVTGHREFVRPPGRFRAALTDEIDGVRGGVVEGTVPAVSIAVASGRSLVVLGEGGEPMARVGPTGAEANVASPTWRLTAASGGAVPDGTVGVDELPRWQPLGPGSTLTWLEPRARYPDPLPPTPILRARRTTVVRTWKVPVELDGRSTELIGTTSWVPEDPAADPVALRNDRGQSRRRGALAAAAAAVVVAGAIALRVRRSARR